MNWPSGGDIYYNSSSNARRNFYGINSIPSARLDGQNVPCTGWAGQIPSLLTSQSPISITITGSYNPANRAVCLHGTVYCETAMTGSSFKIYFCITEDDLYANGRHYNRVCRQVNASGNGWNFSISPGQTQMINYGLTLDAAWKVDDLKVACWVQEFSSKAVQNSDQIDFADLSVGAGVEPTSLGNIKAIYQ